MVDKRTFKKAYKHTWETGTDVHKGVILDSNGTIADPVQPPLAPIWVPNAPQDQLRDACCHLANMTEDSCVLCRLSI